MPATKNDGISRLERAALARKLRDQGYLQREIAEKLGISRTYAAALLCDPDGSKDRERKNKYRGTCIDCGAKTTYDTPGRPVFRCQTCAIQRTVDRKKWTAERIIADIRRWNELYGEPPKAQQWLVDVRGDGTRNSREWPHVACVQREFGSWSNGLEAAGFKPREIGHYDRGPEWRAKVEKWPKERLIQTLQEWAAEHGRTPTSYDFKDVSSPSYTTFQKKFGSWSNALREAGLTPRPRRLRRSSNGTMPPVPSFEERGEGVPLLKVVQDLRPTQKGRSLLDVMRELPERR